MLRCIFLCEDGVYFTYTTDEQGKDAQDMRYNGNLMTGTGHFISNY